MLQLFGCRAAGTDYCWFTDSESMFLRSTSLDDVIGQFLRDPTVAGVYELNDAARQDGTPFNPSTVPNAQKLLNAFEPVGNVGVSYYSW